MAKWSVLVATAEQGGTNQERLAAIEFFQFIQCRVAANVDVELNTPSTASDISFYIGYEACVDNGLDPAVLVSLDPMEGYIISETTMGTGGVSRCIYITGAKASPNGALLGVYRFLEENGFAFLTADNTQMPSSLDESTLVVNSQVCKEPVFESRDVSVFDGMGRCMWANRNGLNGYVVGPRIPGPPPYEYKNSSLYLQLQEFAPWPGFSHSYYSLVPPDVYFKSHPEWFSEIDGKRVGVNAQLCLSNGDLQQFVCKQVAAAIGEDPTTMIISVTQNDCGGYCQCANCEAIYNDEGAVSGAVVRFANVIAASIEQPFPNVRVHTLAYSWSQTPPTKTRPHSNVIIRLSDISCNFGLPLDSEGDAKNVEFMQDLSAWAKMCGTLYVWDYVTCFTEYLMPWPSWSNFDKNMAVFAKYGVKGVYEESNYNSYGGDVAELKGWVLSALMRNPSSSGDELIKSFVQNTFRFPAVCDLVLDYLSLWTEAYASVQDSFRLSIFIGNDAPYITPQVIVKSIGIWLLCEGLCEDDADVLRSIRKWSVSSWYLLVARWSDIVGMFDSCDSIAMSSPLYSRLFNQRTSTEAYNRAVKALVDRCTEFSIVSFSEDKRDLTWLLSSNKVTVPVVCKLYDCTKTSKDSRCHRVFVPACGEHSFRTLYAKAFDLCFPDLEARRWYMDRSGRIHIRKSQWSHSMLALECCWVDAAGSAGASDDARRRLRVHSDNEWRHFVRRYSGEGKRLVINVLLVNEHRSDGM